MVTVSDMLAILDTGDARPRRLAGPRLDGVRASPDTEVAPGLVMSVGPDRYRIVGGLPGVLYPALIPKTPLRGPVRVHAGLHKCLTMLSRRVYEATVGPVGRPRLERWGLAHRPFKHCFHYLRRFHRELAHDRRRILSISGHRLDLDGMGDARVVRIIRDPRDLIVSGLHYHRRGTEPWSRTRSPKRGDFDEVNGGIPSGLLPGQTMQEFVTDADLPTAMRAELEFRRPHLQSMMAWDPSDRRVLTLRYEDILGHEVAAFERIARHFELSEAEVAAARLGAAEFALGGAKAQTGHVRNPKPRQWRDHFDHDLHDAFLSEFGPLLDAYGYPRNAEEGVPDASRPAV